jgi:hypothetical protein
MLQEIQIGFFQDIIHSWLAAMRRPLVRAAKALQGVSRVQYRRQHAVPSEEHATLFSKIEIPQATSKYAFCFEYVSQTSSWVGCPN